MLDITVTIAISATATVAGGTFLSAQIEEQRGHSAIEKISSVLEGARAAAINGQGNVGVRFSGGGPGVAPYIEISTLDSSCHGLMTYSTQVELPAEWAFYALAFGERCFDKYGRPVDEAGVVQPNIVYYINANGQWFEMPLDVVPGKIASQHSNDFSMQPDPNTIPFGTVQAPSAPPIAVPPSCASVNMDALCDAELGMTGLVYSANGHGACLQGGGAAVGVLKREPSDCDVPGYLEAGTAWKQVGTPGTADRGCCLQRTSDREHLQVVDFCAQLALTNPALHLAAQSALPVGHCPGRKPWPHGNRVAKSFAAFRSSRRKWLG